MTCERRARSDETVRGDEFARFVVRSWAAGVPCSIACISIASVSLLQAVLTTIAVYLFFSYIWKSIAPRLIREIEKTTMVPANQLTLRQFFDAIPRGRMGRVVTALQVTIAAGLLWMGIMTNRHDLVAYFWAGTLAYLHRIISAKIIR